MFFRISTDGLETPVSLTGAYSGATRTSCWIVGGGPSLRQLPCDQIAASPAPKFCVNLAGHGLLRPTFWTAYDPTTRFQRSTYLDGSILKLLPRGRAMDVVPGTTVKVCDSPNTVFFDRDKTIGFRDFLGGEFRGVTDWQDSLIQAIDIAYRLGFRVLYLAGCEMHVRPCQDWVELSQQFGVNYQPRELLRDFQQRCLQQQVPIQQLDPEKQTQQYHFEESKPLAAAIQTDLHYFRVAQYLRLSRKAMTLAGLELISVTPDSRLNDYFRYEPVALVLSRIQSEIGNPANEPTRGLYTEQVLRTPEGLGPMRDFKPHNWSRDSAPAKPAPFPRTREQRLSRVANAVREIPVSIREDG
jgi:hypothetical protein